MLASSRREEWKEEAIKQYGEEKYAVFTNLSESEYSIITGIHNIIPIIVISLDRFIINSFPLCHVH